jgi:hypothetical protein
VPVEIRKCDFGVQATAAGPLTHTNKREASLLLLERLLFISRFIIPGSEASMSESAELDRPMIYVTVASAELDRMGEGGKGDHLTTEDSRVYYAYIGLAYPAASHYTGMDGIFTQQRT